MPRHPNSVILLKNQPMSPIKEHDIKEANRSGNYAIPISGGKPSKTTHPGLKCPKIGHGALTQHTNDISNTPNSSGESWSRGPGIAKIVGYITHRSGGSPGSGLGLRRNLAELFLVPNNDVGDHIPRTTMHQACRKPSPTSNGTIYAITVVKPSSLVRIERNEVWVTCQTVFHHFGTSLEGKEANKQVRRAHRKDFRHIAK